MVNTGTFIVVLAVVGLVALGVAMMPRAQSSQSWLLTVEKDDGTHVVYEVCGDEPVITSSGTHLMTEFTDAHGTKIYRTGFDRAYVSPWNAGTECAKP